MNADHDFPDRGAGNRICFRLNGRSILLDKRVNAVRGDLADVSLAGLLFAPHYAKAQPMHCVAEAVFVRESPSADATATTQLLRGETFHLLDVTGGWAWGFCDHDGYVGYIERDALDGGMLTATHHVRARIAPVFATTDIKAPITAMLSAGTRIAGDVSGDFVVTDKGAVHLRHLMPIDVHEADWVDAAERQMGQPYIWGGRGHGGVDCSGLVQLALGQAGIRIPRDTDLQRDGIGTPIADDEPLQRGDLVFFPGHVGIMVDDSRLLHANAYWMSTVIEPLSDVIDRLKPDHEQPVLARRRILL